MNAFAEFLSREAGQRRRLALNNAFAGLADEARYYAGPYLWPTAKAAGNAVAMMNPIADIEDAQINTGRALDSSLPGDERLGAAFGALSSTAAVAAPIVGGYVAKSYNPAMTEDAAQWLTDALSIYSPQVQGGTDAARWFAGDEYGGIRAYHGSPHDFDKFSMDKIGTGEGKQAEGAGLYFGEQRGVGEHYRDVLSSKVSPDHKGTLYEVNINANPEDFLQWDKPFSEQPQAVQDWLASRGISEDFAGSQSGLELMMAERGAMGDKAAAESMKAAGVPGIRYPDKLSRGAGEGSSNYVVFDENLIEIVKKYGIAGAAAMLGVSASDVQAAMQGDQMREIEAYLAGVE